MKIIDLFCGCGGMSLGFELAGFETVVACERDLWAGDTYALNHSQTKLVRQDIREIENWSALLPVNSSGEIDGIIGGPPCQGFSLSGNRDPNDPRNSLFMDFLKCVAHFKPKFLVMENVSGILSAKTAKKERVLEIILNELKGLGYKASFSSLNAAQFGVPQSRDRVFIIGVRSPIPFNRALIYPKPTHSFSDSITVDMAISDLPQIGSGEGTERQDYPCEAKNSYQKWAREKAQGVFNHIAMRHTQRLVERFKVIGHGQSVADVSEEHSALKRGNPSVKSGKIFAQNNMRVIPNRPAPTVAASFQSNFIHPFLNRNFTAREGARLQSFPDHYIFCGKRTTMSWEKHLSQYQQIGNAVPPILAQAIAANIASYFQNLSMINEESGSQRLEQLQLLESAA
jgi:DNA (cytosine-5)-methyltransferase 1